MRFKHPQPFLYFCIFIQVTLAHPKNDHLKNGQRTYPKKYSPTSWAANNNNQFVDSKSSVDEASVKLRHSSKFPHFDQIKTRIAGLDSARSDSSAASLSGSKNRYSDNNRYFNSNNRWGSSETVPRLRHHGWSNRARTTSTTTTTTPSPDDDLFNNYGELDGDDQTEDDYPEDIFDTSDDDDLEYSFQAEEPTSTERTITEPKRYSSLLQYKWEELGTMEKVRQARKNYIEQKSPPAKKPSEESKTTAVVEHYIRVKNSGQCKKPIPKVIPVHVEHPNPAVTYIPHCTVLHRCAEDTGCCKYDATCQYKERVEISLYFYVKQIGADTAKVEKLTFYNHTECECKEKPQDDTQEQLNTTERQKRVASTNSQNTNPKLISGISLRSGESMTSNIPENLLLKCKCPKEFVPKIKFGSKCYCDCENDNEDCLRMKKGKEYNSLTDRLCIQKRQCGTVTCEYGPYNKLKGRCPKYDEA